MSVALVFCFFNKQLVFFLRLFPPTIQFLPDINIKTLNDISNKRVITVIFLAILQIVAYLNLVQEDSKILIMNTRWKLLLCVCAALGHQKLVTNYTLLCCFQLSLINSIFSFNLATVVKNHTHLGQHVFEQCVALVCTSPSVFPYSPTKSLLSFEIQTLSWPWLNCNWLFLFS